MATYNRKMNSGRKRLCVLIVVLTVVLALLIAGTILAIHLTGGQDAPVPVQPSAPQVIRPQLETDKELQLNLGYGLMATQVGSYTGAYVEDGSNEFVSGVLMLRVTNNGEQDVQYAEIDMQLAEGTAKFQLSSLPVGKTVILLEQSRLAWDQNEEYQYAVLTNPVLFPEPVSLHSQQLQLQLLNGGLNVTNISGQDITGDVVIYYKNAQQDLYYGGITYRARLEGGMKAGELKQIMGEHLRQGGTEIVFITVE